MGTDGSMPDLIGRCLSGDEAAWEEVVRQHWRRVFNIAYKFVGRHDEAEDLTQEIFMKVSKSLTTYDRRANFASWLGSVSRNLCIDYYRRVRKERRAVNFEVDPDELLSIPGGDDPSVSLERSDRVALVHKALSAMPETLGTVVLMRDISAMSYEEIAGKLHLPPGTVKSRINRGRAELTRHLQQIREDLKSGAGL
jgi:RNA polymerase sigma-70 factor (ECF subfamily)